MITLRNKRGPVATLTGSDLRPKTARGSIATHDLAGETRAAAAAREDTLPTGAPIREQAGPPPLSPDDGPDEGYFLQEIAAALFPRSIVHGVVVDQDAPRSGFGQLGVASDADRRTTAAVEWCDKIRELIEMDPGRFPRIRRANSRGDSSRMGPLAEGTRGQHLKGLDAIGHAVQTAYEQTGRLPEGQDLVALLDRVEDELGPEGETRSEARTRAAHRIQGVLRKL